MNKQTIGLLTDDVTTWLLARNDLWVRRLLTLSLDTEAFAVYTDTRKQSAFFFIQGGVLLTSNIPGGILTDPLGEKGDSFYDYRTPMARAIVAPQSVGSMKDFPSNHLACKIFDSAANDLTCISYLFTDHPELMALQGSLSTITDRRSKYRKEVEMWMTAILDKHKATIPIFDYMHGKCIMDHLQPPSTFSERTGIPVVPFP